MGGVISFQYAQQMVPASGLHLLGVFYVHKSGKITYTGKIQLWLLCHVLDFNVQTLRKHTYEFQHHDTLSLIIATKDIDEVIDHMLSLHPAFGQVKKVYKTTLWK
jgi:hypothetical protein